MSWWLALAPPLLCAQAVAAPADPADHQVAVPPTVFASPLGAYKPWDAPPARSWREVNDTVARIGGWRVYLREAHQPEPAAAPGPAAPATPGAPQGGAGRHSGHGGHTGHGGHSGRGQP